MLNFSLKGTKAAALGWLFVLVCFVNAAGAQAKKVGRSNGTAKSAAAKPEPAKQGAGPASSPGPKVTKVDDAGFRKLLAPNGKPLMINFWATWCGPCREEFPDLVKLDEEFRGKIDFITISLDLEEEINTGVPKFLGDMKAQMPTYLLVTPDETAAIAAVTKEWAGALPFTVIYDTKGTLAYFKQGKVETAEVRAELNKLLPAAAPTPASASSGDGVFVVADFVKIKDGRRDEAMFFYENNWKLYREEAKKRGVIDSYELVSASSDKNADFDLILLTRYRGEGQLNDSEKNFEPILKQIRPNGPALKNHLKPEDFRQNVFVYRGRSVFLSRN